MRSVAAYHPSAVPRSVGLYMSPITLEPMIKNEVPWNAVKILKMKNAAKLGDSAVPMLAAVNSVALMTETYNFLVSRQCLDGHHLGQRGLGCRIRCVPIFFRISCQWAHRNKG